MILIGGYYIVILMFDLFIYLIVGNIMSILYLLLYIVLVLFLINNEVFGNIFFCFIYSIYFFLKNWLKKKKNWYFKVIIIIF